MKKAVKQLVLNGLWKSVGCGEL